MQINNLRQIKKMQDVTYLAQENLKIYTRERKASTCFFIISLIPLELISLPKEGLWYLFGAELFNSLVGFLKSTGAIKI